MPPAVVDPEGVYFLFRRDSRAELYRPHLTGRLLVVSFMTVAELDRWALERNWREARRQKMERHLTSSSIPSTASCAAGGSKRATEPGAPEGP